MLSNYGTSSFSTSRLGLGNAKRDRASRNSVTPRSTEIWKWDSDSDSGETDEEDLKV